MVSSPKTWQSLSTKADSVSTASNATTAVGARRPAASTPADRRSSASQAGSNFHSASFGTKYMLKNLDGAPSLRIRRNGDCIFWDGGCTVYSVRPRQCRTFPFWPENIDSRESWNAVKETCHGAGKGKAVPPRRDPLGAARPGDVVGWQRPPHPPSGHLVRWHSVF